METRGSARGREHKPRQTGSGRDASSDAEARKHHNLLRRKDLEDVREHLDLQLARREAELEHLRERLLDEIAARKGAQQKLAAYRESRAAAERDVIYKLSEITETRCRENSAHVTRVAELASFLGEACGLDAGRVELIRLAAPMHDAGKVAVPDRILNFPGPLSPSDFEIVKTHTTAGRELLVGSDRDVLRMAATIAEQHHERFDGTGYPRGLKGEQITIAGRVACLADVFDALSSDRVYRPAWKLEDILTYIRDQRGKLFDPYLVDEFFGHLDQVLAIRYGDDVPELPEECRTPATALRRTETEPRPTEARASEDAPENRPADTNQEAPAGEDDPNVLLAMEDPTRLRELSAALRADGFRVTLARHGREAWHLLSRAKTPLLALLDENLEAMDGQEVCRAVRDLASEQYAYLILLTNGDDRLNVISGMKAGADVCVTKPYDIQELLSRIHAAQRILRLQSDLLETRESLRHRATHDALTELWNRGAILDLLEREMDRARRESAALTAVMVDLDHFKHVNDNYGHRVGDAVLREAGRRMRNVMRPYDLVGRYGGEEFLSLIPRCGSSFARYIAERLHRAIGEEPIIAAGVELRLTASLGVATFSGGDATGDELVQAADHAMYRAKRAGRDRVVVEGDDEAVRAA